MKLKVNGDMRDVVEDWQDENLLVVLREHFGLVGSRFSCGIGQCGACVVHVDGEPVSSCLVPVSEIENKEVLTVESLAAADGTLHPLQQAWLDENVPQCGYCQSGQLMQALSLLQHTPNPNDDDIDTAMSGHLCRCGTYERIRKAIKRAALTMQEAS